MADSWGHFRALVSFSASTPETDELVAEARRRFARFVREQVNPGASERDRLRRPLSRDLFREAADIGLLNFALPTEVGGAVRDKFEWGVIVEELSYLSHDPALTGLIDISVGVTELILSSSRPSLIERYAVPMARGERLGVQAAYESRDPYDYASTATRVP